MQDNVCFTLDLSEKEITAEMKSQISVTTTLTSLDLYNTDISDLDFLISLKNLKELDISGTKVSELFPLSELTCLEKLVAYDVPTYDLSPLKERNALGARFAGRDLAGIQIPGADLSGAVLTYTCLRGADLSWVILKNAYLQYTDLREANLQGAQFGEWLTLHQDKVYSLAYRFDGLKIAVGAGNNIILYKKEGKAFKEEFVFKEHTGEVRSVAFSPDGEWLASGSFDCTVRLWDMKSYEQVNKFTHKNTVYSVAFSSDGQQVISGSADNTVCLWSTMSKENAYRGGVGFLNTVYSVAFSPDGRQIASGSNTFQLLDAITLQVIANLEGGHTGFIYSIAFSADGLWLASGSNDKGNKYNGRCF